MSQEQQAEISALLGKNLSEKKKKEVLVGISEILNRWAWSKKWSWSKEVTSKLTISSSLDFFSDIPAQLQEAYATANVYLDTPANWDASLPNDQEIIDQITAKLTPKDIQKLKEFNKPTILLVPMTSGYRHVVALNRKKYHTMEGQGAPYESDFFKSNMQKNAQTNNVKNHKITQWKIAIVEWAQVFDPQPWDNTKKTFKKRINLAKQYFKDTQISGMTYAEYITCMISGLRHGKPMDVQYEGGGTKKDVAYDYQYSILSGEKTQDSVVACAYWRVSNRHVDLGGRFLSSERVHARVRLSLKV